FRLWLRGLRHLAGNLLCLCAQTGMVRDYGCQSPRTSFVLSGWLVVGGVGANTVSQASQRDGAACRGGEQRLVEGICRTTGRVEEAEGDTPDQALFACFLFLCHGRANRDDRGSGVWRKGAPVGRT